MLSIFFFCNINGWSKGFESHFRSFLTVAMTRWELQATVESPLAMTVPVVPVLETWAASWFLDVSAGKTGFSNLAGRGDWNHPKASSALSHRLASFRTRRGEVFVCSIWGFSLQQLKGDCLEQIDSYQFRFGCPLSNRHKTLLASGSCVDVACYWSKVHASVCHRPVPGTPKILETIWNEFAPAENACNERTAVSQKDRPSLRRWANAACCLCQLPNCSTWLDFEGLTNLKASSVATRPLPCGFVNLFSFSKDGLWQPECLWRPEFFWSYPRIGTQLQMIRNSRNRTDFHTFFLITFVWVESFSGWNVRPQQSSERWLAGRVLDLCRGISSVGL